MNCDLEIVAIGARTPVGRTAASSAAAVRAGISRCREFPFVTPGGAPLVVASDADLDPATEGWARLEPMLSSVLEQVTHALARGVQHLGTHHIFLALPEERPGFTGRDATELVAAVHVWLRRSHARADIHIAGRGHAGAIRAIEHAVQSSSRDPNALCWIAGVDSYVNAATLLWLESERRCAQPGIRSGFIPGEAAGCLALAGPDLRRRLRLPALAHVRAVQTAHESRLRDSDTGSFGLGMIRAVEGAAAQLHLPSEGVDTLYADINGERYRSEEWGFVAMRTAPVFKSLQYQAQADLWGDVGSAFVPLAVILAAQSFQRSYARGPRAMVIAGSDGGLRGAVLLQRPPHMTVS